MTTRNLLLEIGLEELPARFVTSAMDQFAADVQNWLTEHRIEFGEVIKYSTPRRLAVLIKNVAETQTDIHEEARGPSKKIAYTAEGDWSKAAEGFSRGQGMTVEDIYFKEINGTEYAHIQKFIKGKSTLSLLTGLKDVLEQLSFPINMRWGSNKLRYLRPIKWIVALFGQEVIPFSITNVSTNSYTYGHRFLGKKVAITDPKDYESKLAAEYVIVDPDKRREMIISQLKEIETAQDWLIELDEQLLAEVNNLVEYPTALSGRFEEHFLNLPEDVLVTSMREHQRYFAVRNDENQLLPYFITVRNGDDNYLDVVVRGNEKVLQARLADAQFFYEEDQRVEIAEFLKRLETVVYHEDIGTIVEKMARVRSLSNGLATNLSLADEEKELVNRAAEICKFDLVTLMVNEFPELQGLMGEKYALLQGENPQVAKAIVEHYQPRYAGDKPPTADVSAVLSVADKLDTVASFFAIGVIPSGSQDPYALRRQATGVVETLLSKKWDLELEQLIDLAIKQLVAVDILQVDKATVAEQLTKFFRLRLKNKLQDLKIDHDIVEAVLASPKIGSVLSLIDRARVLQAEKVTDSFKPVAEALSRVLNIAKNHEQTAEINTKLFENDYEVQLFNKFIDISKKYETAENAKQQFNVISTLQNDINNYFDNTMVMVEDEQIRANRLNQMIALAEFIKGFAKINKVITK